MLMSWGAIIFYAFAAIAAVQLFYYLYFFKRVAFYKPKPKEHSQQQPVSVIICARDEDENIAKNLPGILVQHYSSTHEVIVVNDNSLDDSKYILAELQKTFNTIWEVKVVVKRGIIPILKARLFSFGLILAISFLLIIHSDSLIITLRLLFSEKSESAADLYIL